MNEKTEVSIMISHLEIKENNFFFNKLIEELEERSSDHDVDVKVITFSDNDREIKLTAPVGAKIGSLITEIVSNVPLFPLEMDKLEELQEKASEV